MTLLHKSIVQRVRFNAR